MANVHGEPGAARVAEAIAAGSAINLVNWTEVLTVIAREGRSVSDFLTSLTEWRILGSEGLLTLVSITDQDAQKAAEIYAFTGASGLSLGDRLCVATGLRLRLPILTADRLWGELDIPNADIRLIRD